MSCYFRHMKDVLEEAGIRITEKNKKEVDRLLHELVGVEYKHCSPTWKAIKGHIKEDPAARKRFIERLRKAYPVTGERA